MPTFPLPFIIPILLFILLIRLVQLRRHAAAVFIGIYAVDAVAVALRWSFHWEAARVMQPILALAIPLAAWRCFTPLKGQPVRLWPWLAAALIPYLLTIAWIPWNPGDLVLGPLYLGMGAALISLNWNREDSLGAARLSDMRQARSTLYIAGGALVAISIYDSIIAADFDLYGGVHAMNLVVGFDLVAVPLLAYAAAVASPVLVREADPDPEPGAQDTATAVVTPPDDDDLQVFAVFNGLMKEKALFKDPDLTLNRLARRMTVPARSLSIAVNRATGRNISQVVNEFRIAEARRLLSETQMPVIDVMENVGFRTKSNFNREFLRVAGVSPSLFRQSSAP